MLKAREPLLNSALSDLGLLFVAELHVIKHQITQGIDACLKPTLVHEELRCMMVSDGF